MRASAITEKLEPSFIMCKIISQTIELCYEMLLLLIRRRSTFIIHQFHLSSSLPDINLTKILRWLLKRYSKELAGLIRSNSRFAAYMGNDTVLTILQSGHKIYVDALDVSMTPHLIIDGIWEPSVTLAFKKAVGSSKTFFDIGANVGYYSLLAAQQMKGQGRIFAFEPNPRTYNLLLNNIDINGYADFCNVENVALGAKASEMSLAIVEKHRGGASFFRSEQNNELLYHDTISNRVQVAVDTLDNYCAHHSIEKIDMMKIDVEGAEPLLVAGMQQQIGKNNSLILFMEWYRALLNQSCNPEHFAQQLVDLGFDLNHITPEGDIQKINKEYLLSHQFVDLYLVK